MRKTITVLLTLVTITLMINSAFAAGFDQWGYNQKALIFNGWYVNAYAGRENYWPGPTGTAYVGIKGDPCGNIVSYFASAPAGSVACDSMGNPSGPDAYWYAYNVWVVMNWNKAWDTCNSGTCTPDAWITNHQTGWYLGQDNKVHQWEYFVKIVWIGGNRADGTQLSNGGYVIWGSYEVIQEVYNDPYGGYHGILTHAIPSGLG